MKYDIRMSKVSERKLNEDNTRDHFNQIVTRINGMSNKDITARMGSLKAGDDGETYFFNIILSTPFAEEENAFEVDKVIELITEHARRRSWNVLSTETFGNDVNLGEGVVTRSPFIVPELTQEVMETVFDGIYEREPHIRIIHDSVKNYSTSGGKVRSHILLYGKPAGAKTSLLERFKEFYDDENERVVFIDGPTMTKAGLENWLVELAESSKLPEIIVIEEIEKQNKDNLLILLSLMASGKIMRTNSRVGRDEHKANCLIWATCNDEEELKNFRNGALHSRFTHKLYCARPNRALMHKILLKKIEERNGNPVWADIALKFADDLQAQMAGLLGKKVIIDDPREIVGFLDGGDRLMDSSYQNDFLDILQAKTFEGEEHQDDEMEDSPPKKRGRPRKNS